MSCTISSHSLILYIKLRSLSMLLHTSQWHLSRYLHCGVRLHATHVVLLMQGRTALHCAAINNHSSIARAILSHGASDIDARSNAVRCCMVYANHWHAMGCLVCSNGVLLDCMHVVKGYAIMPVVLVQPLMIEVCCVAYSCPCEISLQYANCCGSENL